jgi:hypothetical protein
MANDSDPQARLNVAPSDEWNDDDFDVLADGVVVDRIFKLHAAPVGTPCPCLWAP